MAVAFDVSTKGEADATTCTYSHTCTGTNLVLVVHVGGTANTVDPTGVTYNGVAMTKIISKPLTTDGDNCSLWILAAPASGAHNVVVTFAASQKMIIHSTSFTGGDQTTGYSNVADAHGASTTPSATVTSAANEMVLACINSLGLVTSTPGTGETERYDAANVSQLTSHGFTEAGAPSVTMAPTLSGNQEWSEMLVSIKEFSSAAVTTPTQNQFARQAVRRSTTR